jgi:hypothetical protein
MQAPGVAAQRDQEVLPGAEAIVSGFRANYHSFPALRILWTYRQEMTDAAFKIAEKRAERHAKDSNDQSKTPRERENALRQYKFASNTLTNPVLRIPSIIIREFRTDRTNYQSLIFRESNLTDLPGGYSFSRRLKANPMNLRTVFARTRITAFDRSKSRFMMWIGQREGKEYYQGQLTITKPHDSLSFAPPLGIDTDAWNGNWNPIDAFFAHPANQMTVVRSESLGGAQTYVLEYKDERDLPSDFLTKELRARFPGKLRLYSITTAWVDARRGFLPLRIETAGAFFYEGRRLGPPPGLTELVIVSEIKKIDGGGWYPTSGRVDSLNQDPEWSKGQNTIEMLLTNQSHNIPHVIERTASWATQNIEVASDTTDLFEFEFPNDTEYYDEKAQKFLFTGDRQAYVDKVLIHQDSSIRLKSKALGLLRLIGFNVAVVVLIVIVCVVSLYVWRRAMRANR